MRHAVMFGLVLAVVGFAGSAMPSGPAVKRLRISRPALLPGTDR